MSNNEAVIIELERCIALLRTGAPQKETTRQPEGDALGAWRRGRITYYEEKTTETARGPWTRARIGVGWRDGAGNNVSEFYSANFDVIGDTIIEKGANIEYQSTTNAKGFHTITAMRSR